MVRHDYPRSEFMKAVLLPIRQCANYGLGHSWMFQPLRTC